MTDIISELRPIGQLFASGSYGDALLALDRLWCSVPDPKEGMLNSFLIVSYGAIISLKSDRLDDALVWAQRGLAYSGNFNLAGESEFLLGEVAFARADYETAFKCFKTVKQISGWRLFKNKDPRYRKLVEGI